VSRDSNSELAGRRGTQWAHLNDGLGLGTTYHVVEWMRAAPDRAIMACAGHYHTLR